MCFKIAELLGSTPEFWVRLQAQYDVKMAERNKKITNETRKVHRRIVAYKKKTAAWNGLRP
jgi:plasmid maintenance system antidote protein VapI